jgi:hypothetical protein
MIGLCRFNDLSSILAVFKICTAVEANYSRFLVHHNFFLKLMLEIGRTTIVQNKTDFYPFEIVENSEEVF